MVVRDSLCFPGRNYCKSSIGFWYVLVRSTVGFAFCDTFWYVPEKFRYVLTCFCSCLMFLWYVLVHYRTVPVRSTLTFPWFNDNVVRSGTFCLTVARILLIICLSNQILKRPFRHPVARTTLVYVPIRSEVRSGTFHDGISTSGACWPGLAP